MAATSRRLAKALGEALHRRLKNARAEVTASTALSPRSLGVAAIGYQLTNGSRKRSLLRLTSLRLAPQQVIGAMQH